MNNFLELLTNTNEKYFFEKIVYQIYKNKRSISALIFIATKINIHSKFQNYTMKNRSLNF